VQGNARLFISDDKNTVSVFLGQLLFTGSFLSPYEKLTCVIFSEV